MKNLLSIMILFTVFWGALFAQDDIPFSRDIDMQTNDIKNVGEINGFDADDLGVVSFSFANMGSNPTDVGFADQLRYKLNISANVSIQIAAPTAGTTPVVSWYLIYTGQPTVTILPPSGWTILWGFEQTYTGPSTSGQMDKLIIEVMADDQLLIYPALINTPKGSL